MLLSQVVWKQPAPSWRPYPMFKMHHTYPIEHLDKIIHQIRPGVTLTAVEPVPSTYLPRLFNIILSDSTKVLLTLPPSLGIRLLRQERNLIGSQVGLLTYLNQSNLLARHIIYPESCPSTKASSRINHAYEGLSALPSHVPKLLEYHLESQDSAVPYILSTTTEGSSLSAMSLYLTLPERQSVNLQLLALSHTLSLITSPNGNFGLASNVLSSLINTPSCPPPTSSSGNSSTSPSRTPKLAEQGNTSWSQTFLILMESSMRDAEDMLVNIPYHEIRRYLRIYPHYFDEVKIPRLVVMGLRDEENVVIVRENGSCGEEENAVRVMGLRDWSGGVFGDGELGAADEDTNGEGGDCDADEYQMEIEAKTTPSRSTSDIVLEDREAELGRRFRKLMYICYRAVVTISTEYQRPRPDSMKRDDEARIKMTAALTQLKDLEGVLRTAE